MKKREISKEEIKSLLEDAQRRLRADRYAIRRAILEIANTYEFSVLTLLTAMMELGIEMPMDLFVPCWTPPDQGGSILFSFSD